MRFSVSIGDRNFAIEIAATEGRWQCQVEGREIALDFIPLGKNAGSLLIDGKSFEVRRDTDGGIFVGARRYAASIEDPRSWQGRRRSQSGHSGPQKLIASMPGKIVRILARDGAELQAGQGVVVVEAMKMQNEIKAPRSGKLQKVLVREGANVTPGEVLAIVE